DDEASGSDFVADELRGEALAFGDVGHFFSEEAFAGEVHLRHVGVAGAGGFGTAIGAPAGAGFEDFKGRIGRCHGATSQWESGICGDADWMKTLQRPDYKSVDEERSGVRRPTASCQRLSIVPLQSEAGGGKLLGTLLQGRLCELGG